MVNAADLEIRMQRDKYGISVGSKEYELGLLRTELEKVKQEKEGFDFKIAKFDKSAKDLHQLLGSQITNKSKKGFGYNVVPSPHPLILNRPTTLYLSYSGLEEFKEPENTNDSLEQQQMTDTETSSFESPLKVDKDWKEKFFYPTNHDEDESPVVVKKKTVIPTAAKIQKPVRKPMRYAEMYSFDHIQYSCPNQQRKRIVSGNNYNKKDNDYYSKPSHPSTHKHMAPRAVLMKTGLKSFNTERPVNTVRSVNTDFKDFDGGYVTFGGGAYGGRITSKGIQGVSESSTSSQQDQDNQDCIVMPIWKDASYFGDAAPRSVVDAQIQDKDGLHNENDATEKSHDDSSLKDNGTAINTARPEINTGSREVSTANDDEPNPKVEKKIVIPTATKKEFVKPVKRSVRHTKQWSKSSLTDDWLKSLILQRPVTTVRFNTGRPFRSTVNTVRARGFNAVKPSACWVGRPSNPMVPTAKLLGYTTLDPEMFKENLALLGSYENEPKDRGNNRVYRSSLINTARLKVNTGSREASTAVPEVNTTTPEDLSSVQTRRMITSYFKLGFLSAIYEGKSHQDLHTCLFACFLSQEEPKRVSKALSDPAWVEAMQEELL
ncbi:hypothetical protein Tco_1256536 [Tanacetum coccineum]